MKKMVALVLSLLVVALFAGSPQKTAVPAKGTLLFFMNPNGSPCQMQNQILLSMGKSLTDKVQVKYLKTTEFQSSRPYFEQYGIRGLPTLIVLDSKGKIKYQFTPGVQEKEQIISKL